MRVLISAGEASGDMYAAGLLSRLRERFPSAEFYGCAGPKLQALGVNAIIDSSKLAVVGLAEVVGHLPRIYGEYRKLLRYIRAHPPQVAVLTDSPDFHLRLARHLKRLKVPVFYLVAPQVWAWRPGRVKTIRKRVDRLFCLFPFEEAWFRARGVDATYIGHPLAKTVRSTLSKEEFFKKHSLEQGVQTIVLLPGSRSGEVRRHLPILIEAIAMLRLNFRLNVLLAVPTGFTQRADLSFFREPFRNLSIQVIEGETWDCIGHSDVALAASGTVTIETAILGTPMVTYYKVTPLTWWAGRRLVKVPFLSMVNLIADRQIVPELIQENMTPGGIAGQASMLLRDPARVERMRSDLAEVRSALTSEGDPLERVASEISRLLQQTTNQESAQETIK